MQDRLQLQIDALAKKPRPASVTKLEGEENQYRIQVGDYRIVYEIQDPVLLIVLLRIGHRREVDRKR